MGRYAIILVAGFSLILGVMKLQMNRSGNQAGQVTAARYESLAARNLANSGAALCLNQMKQNRTWRTGYSHLVLHSGTLEASLVNAGQDSVRLSVTGTIGPTSETIQLLVGVSGATWPTAVDAGITARANVSTLGNMLVDGRDHDWDGNLIANNGLKAISTTAAYARGGNSKVAGTTAGGIDLAPTKVSYDSIVAQGKVWPGGYPSTPDLVMGGAGAGYPEGTLKIIAQSGYEGSQYVTNPALLTYPLSGVTYIELPSGSSWLPVNFGSDSQGVLVVHNANTNAVMKNLNSGIFKGLLIADDVVHIHTQIIGAMFLLTTGPSEGNCIGNGNGSLLFCREAVDRGVSGTGASLANVSVLDYWE